MKTTDSFDRDDLPEGLKGKQPEVPAGYFSQLQFRLEAIPREYPGAAATPERRWRQGYKPWVAALAAAAALTAALVYLPNGTAPLEPSAEELQQLYLDGDYSISISENTLLEVLTTDDFSEPDISNSDLLEINDILLNESYN
jgi:hypothetical protein